MRRGELRRYIRPSTPERPRTVAIMSSDGINDSTRPLAAHITRHFPSSLVDPPDSVLQRNFEQDIDSSVLRALNGRCAKSK